MVLWVFGYGSLIWRTGFNYDERVIGYVKNYKRVFHQGSVDHRGTVEKPGRTATLAWDEGAVTWGAAFRVSGYDEEKIVMAYLDVRERAYNLKAKLDFYTVDSSNKPAISGVLTYIATSDSSNFTYLGPAPMTDMARQIATAHGPSGLNRDYLFNLESALQELGPECVDEELVELANEVREVLATSSNTPPFGGKLNGLNGLNPLNGQHLTNHTHQSHQLNSNSHHLFMVES